VKVALQTAEDNFGWDLTPGASIRVLSRSQTGVTDIKIYGNNMNVNGNSTGECAVKSKIILLAPLTFLLCECMIMVCPSYLLTGLGMLAKHIDNINCYSELYHPSLRVFLDDFTLPPKALSHSLSLSPGLKPILSHNTNVTTSRTIEFLTGR
jgi:hypothetical protein